MIKKALIIFISIFMISAALEINIEAEGIESDISRSLSETETGEAEQGLEELGIDPGDVSGIRNLSVSKILEYVSNIFKKAINAPVKLILTVTAFAAICSVSSAVSFRGGLYSELFVLICFIAVSPSAVESFMSSVKAIKGASAFMLSYIPVFASLAAASGNLASAVSYNAILMYFCEAAAVITSTLLKPILCGMLILSAVQALNPDMTNLTSALKNILTVVIGFIMTLFLGILALQTVVGRGAEGLAVRAGKYAVSSFVPVIGYSLSESYKAVSLSLSAIRTATGAFGIVVLGVFLLTPIISALIYKASFLFSGWICRLIGADRLSSMMYGLADVFSFLSTTLIFFGLMLTVATGTLILLGGALSL